MSPRGLVTLCIKCHMVCQISHNHGQFSTSIWSSKYTGTHIKKTHLLYQSLYCSHFTGPISSVKLQTNFLGIPFKMIHPHFQSIFPISYWRPLVFWYRRPGFTVQTLLLIFLFCLFYFLFRLSDGDQIVRNLLMNHLFYLYPPRKATPHSTFLGDMLPSS